MPSERFDYSNYTDEELFVEYERAKNERQEDYDSLEDPALPSELRSELLNSDIPYINDKIEALENEIKKREYRSEQGGRGR